MSRPVIAFGPVMPGWGSWEWIGEDLSRELSKWYTTTTFHGDDVPPCDVAVVVKHALPLETVRKLALRCRVVYCPVDYYGCRGDVTADAEMLRACSSVVLHCEELRQYFEPFSECRYVDHHIKHAAPLREEFLEGGDFLWVGVRSNLPPVVDWMQGANLPGRLRVLTNFEDSGAVPEPTRLGFPGGGVVTLSRWSPQRQLAETSRCRAALDIKGTDFRSSHKPPAKAIDFLASGVPLAMNADSSPVRHSRTLGFDVASPEDVERWLSREYWQETREFGELLRDRLSLTLIGQRWKEILDEVLDLPLSANDTGPSPTSINRVALVSFFFDWPSTGGGIVHTVELATALERAGYEVRHFHPRYRPWGIGKVTEPLPFDSSPIEFGEHAWTMPTIQDRIRRAVDEFDPTSVIVTDSWNSKPLLAEALRKYRVILRLQGMECLCPLNNVRLLPQPDGQARQCELHQLGHSDRCVKCIEENEPFSGFLHNAERRLCSVGSDDYRETLLTTFREAEAVLVVNPLTEGLVRPFAPKVRVVTAGMDTSRFPWPWPDEVRSETEPLRLFFAGLTEEWMKGFHVLHGACSQLWKRRQDFVLEATADPVGPRDAFTHHVGWLSQQELPARMRRADIVVVPTLAQEGLGRSAVEAMGVGRPVVASRIGGLITTVVDGVTGLLFEPGNSPDLEQTLERLMDDAQLRASLGVAGRERFESHYTWDHIIETHYKPLLQGD